MRMNLWVLNEKRNHLLRVVCREIVGDEVDLASYRLAGQDVAEKPDKLIRSVPLGSLADNIPRVSGKGRIQRQGSVALVLKAMPFSASRRQRQHWVFSVKRLNGWLLLHTEHPCMGRWMEIQPNEIGCLLLDPGVDPSAGFLVTA